MALVEPVLRLGRVAQRAERTCVVCKEWSRPSRCARADATMSASAASKAYRELLVVQRRLFGADMQARMAARVETRAQFMLHANAPADDLDKLLNDAKEAAGFLTHNVAQTVRDDTTGHYKMEAKPEHITRGNYPGHLPDGAGEDFNK